MGGNVATLLHFYETFFSLSSELWKILLSLSYLTCEGLWSNWVVGYLDFKPHLWVTAFEFILKILNAFNLQLANFWRLKIFFEAFPFVFSKYGVWYMAEHWLQLIDNFLLLSEMESQSRLRPTCQCTSQQHRQKR